MMKTRKTARELGPKESGIQSAVYAYLRLDPRVADVWRQNNGAAKMPGPEGKMAFVRFARNEYGHKVTVLDLTGYTTDGRRLEIEVKRKMPLTRTINKWKETPDHKLGKDGRIFLEQMARIDHCKRNGVVSGFVTSVTEMQALLDRAMPIPNREQQQALVAEVRNAGRSVATPFSHKVAEAVCAEMREGKSLVQIARAPDMPSARTVWHWRRKGKEMADGRTFQAWYEEAEMERAEALGVCPCCKRTFVDLARHMTSKHPEYMKDEGN